MGITKDDDESRAGRLVIKTILISLGSLFLLIAGCGSFYTIQPGVRGIAVTLGKADANFKTDGFHTKMPFITSIEKIIIRQQTREMIAETYSADLQQMKVTLKILYRIPEARVVQLFRDYHGDPFDNLIGPRVQESLKEVTATASAEIVVKNRESIKQKTLEICRKKVGDLLIIEDIVIENIDLSKELEKAIEEKMVQSQHAEKAKFAQVQAKTDAETAVIKANGEAESIRVRANALQQNPRIVELMIVERWDGKTPQTVVTGSGGANILLPLK